VLGHPEPVVAQLVGPPGQGSGGGQGVGRGAAGCDNGQSSTDNGGRWWFMTGSDPHLYGGAGHPGFLHQPFPHRLAMYFWRSAESLISRVLLPTRM